MTTEELDAIRQRAEAGLELSLNVRAKHVAIQTVLRTDIPELLDEVERLEKRVATLEGPPPSGYGLGTNRGTWTVSGGERGVQ